MNKLCRGFYCRTLLPLCRTIFEVFFIFLKISILRPYSVLAVTKKLSQKCNAALFRYAFWLWISQQWMVRFLPYFHRLFLRGNSTHWYKNLIHFNFALMLASWRQLCSLYGDQEVLPSKHDVTFPLIPDRASFVLSHDVHRDHPSRQFSRLDSRF